jgi:hypothetical protein
VDVVTVTAGATNPEPPLALALDWPLLAVGLGVLTLAAGALVVAATLRPVRGTVT